VILAAKRLSQPLTWDDFLQQGGLLATVLTVVAIALLIFVVVRVRELFSPRRTIQDSPEELLLRFRDIHRQGDLTQDEYNNIRELLMKKSGDAGSAEDAADGSSADVSAKTPPECEL
jgi:heme exporter protein D